MKKFLSVLLVSVLIASFALTALADSGDIAIDSSWSVLVSQQPSTYEIFAARKISDELSTVFGKEISIVNSADEKYIAIGSVSSAELTTGISLPNTVESSSLIFRAAKLS